ncbi:MAG TPA: type I methionyl aminopeptidase [Acidimicrobiales bacterium]|jgi:methionyl aminopeptidase|nr:type I methionyl aminopeptidase [Acidimicrobiales bacterium]
MNRVLPKANDPCWCGSGRKYKRCHRDGEGKIQPGVISPRRSVPDSIERPEYARPGASGEPRRWAEPMVKSADVLARMRVAGQVAAEVLAETGAAVRPGITTDELDAVCHQACLARGAYPSPLGYRGYPKSVCTSVNEVICHGIPDDRPLADGDIVDLDVTVFLNGVHGDTNGTFLVGDVDDASRRLVRVTEECLQLGIAAVRPGQPLSDIGRAIEAHATSHHLGVVRMFVGHGIGERFHGDPNVPHFFTPSASTVMQPGMTFTIEPMITMGTWRERMWDDGWTAVTADGRRSAQFEHTLVVTPVGAEVLTLTAAGKPGWVL